MNNIEIKISNITPTLADADYDKIIEMWQAIGEFFQKKSLPCSDQREIKVTLDVSNVLEKLNSFKDGNYEHYFAEIAKEQNFKTPEQLLDFNLLGATLRIILAGDVENENEYINRFLDQLFISMNLSYAGSCNLFEYEIIENHAFSFFKTKRKLAAYLFENAIFLNREWKWPKLAENECITTWNWLESQNIRNFSLAKSSVQKACAIILNLSEKDNIEASDVIGVTQVLESFLLTKNESKTKGLELKLHSIFGEPSDDKRWIKKLYSLRSSIAHGEHDILRPSYHPEENDNDSERHCDLNINFVEKGFLVIMAILKDLVSQNKSKFIFTYHVEMKRKE